MLNTPKNEQEALKNLEEGVKKVLYPILKDVNSIREGIIMRVNGNRLTLQVQVMNSGEIINDVRFIANSASNVAAGQMCLLLSSDPFVKNRVYALVFN